MCVGWWVLSRSVGYRFGKLLPATMPVMMDCCSSAAESDDEMRENALQVWTLLM